MSTVTLELVEAEHKRLAAMIDQLRAAAAPRFIQIDETEIELQPGEHYAGTVLDEAGRVKHHLVLMAQRPEERLTWQAAMDWAASVGGSLPDRQEQALLFANCKPHLEETWHWSSATHESNASCAWGCDFDDGYQGHGHESFEGAAVAVRRL